MAWFLVACAQLPPGSGSGVASPSAPFAGTSATTLADRASLVLVEGAYGLIGGDLATGTDDQGVALLGIGGRSGGGFERLPSDGVVDLWVSGVERYTPWAVAVTDWDAPLVAAVDGDL